MLDRESEEHWRAIKESYPDAIVFHETGGLFVVRGRDIEVLAAEFGLRSSGPWVGFDDRQACGYMLELVRRGYAVVRAAAGHVSHVSHPADRGKELRRQRAKGRFMAVEPRLVFDPGDMERSAGDGWRRKRGYEELFERFKRCLQNGDRRSFREYGELYIYQVGDWYEVDWELTTLDRGHALLLATAALAAGCKLPCRLVEPKSHRNRRPRRARTLAVSSEEAPPKLGQLGFDDLPANWSTRQ